MSSTPEPQSTGEHLGTKDRSMESEGEVAVSVAQGQDVSFRAVEREPWRPEGPHGKEPCGRTPQHLTASAWPRAGQRSCEAAMVGLGMGVPVMFAKLMGH